MEVDYQIVVDQSGSPKSVLISWDDFQEIQTRLKKANSVTNEQQPAEQEKQDSSEEKESVEYTADPTEYKAGGDYKPLASIGVDLPKALKRTVVPTDRPEIPDEEVHEIKIGKRIR